MKDNGILLLKDIIGLLKEKSEESRERRDNDPMKMGRHLAYYDILSIIHDQALAFGINLEDIGMLGYNPDRDAL